MTAKEMAELAEEENHYIFRPEEFEQFCVQLCKEQREICFDEYDKSFELFTDGDTDSIINAPMPEL